MHISSSKDKKNIRAHNNYINYNEYKDFFKFIQSYDIDIMIEAKMKDDDLFRLVRELKYKTNDKFIDDTSFIV